MNKLILNFFCLFLCCANIISVFAQKNYQQQKDSLRKVIASTQGKEKLDAYNKLGEQMFYYEDNIDTILVFYGRWEKEAEKQKNVELQGTIKYRTVAILGNRNRMEEYLTFVYPTLDFLKKHELWQRYDYLQNGLSRTYVTLNKHSEAIQVAKLFYEETKQSNRKEGIGVALQMLSYIYLCRTRYADSEEHARKSIEIFEGLEYSHFLIPSAYSILVDALNYQKKWVETLKALKDWETFLDKTGNPIVEMCDFYWLAAIAYIDMKNFVKGEEYLLKLDSMQANHFKQRQHSQDLFWAKILEGKQKYAQALDLIDASYDNISKDVEILPVKARILCKMGRGAEAYPLYERAIELRDSIQRTYVNIQLDELRIEYEVDKHIAEKERNRNYFLFALGSCVLLFIALGIWIFLHRKIRKKNRTLAQQIKELTALQEGQDNELLAKTTFIPEEESTETPDDELYTASRLDKLCLAIRDLVLKDKIYRNPAITQELVIETLATNRRNFSEAFEYCFKMQFKDYINFLRMKDAVMLLEQSDLSIEEIADTVGFGTVRTFQRQFNARYNMSPKEYKGAMIGGQ